MNSENLPVRVALTVGLFFVIIGQALAASPAQNGGASNSLSSSAVSDAAAEAEFRPGYPVCLKAHPAVRPSERCTADEIDYQDARLDAEYHTLLKRLHGAARTDLRADQEHWSQALNDECMVFSHRQGSLNSMKAQDCFLYGAARRRLVLEQQYGSGRR